ncbi:hypothetical protein ZHAS_00011207 [Anopheles sinensis]|uniref:Uncharacterized protein n=1 Tax=Anopheles sinensis TaxID=74873 RepID=A0A084VZL5_ANOSI|nr:hypothetical protein ZHAS_00011207 [Anopheles sinensis]
MQQDAEYPLAYYLYLGCLVAILGAAGEMLEEIRPPHRKGEAARSSSSATHSRPGQPNRETRCADEQVITTAMRRVCYIDAHVLLDAGWIWIALGAMAAR